MSLHSSARLKTCLLIVLLMLSVSPTFAWGKFGHKAVAYTAWENLNEPTKSRCMELLKLNKSYPRWSSKTKGWSWIEKDPQIFMDAAVWADDIKGFYKNDGYSPSESEFAFENDGYKGRHQHRYWHFVDLPYSQDGTEGQPPEEPTAKTQIEAFTRVLRSDTAPDDLKSFDLCWLLHLVGDVHQPLHCITRVDKKHKNGDRGGNSVKLTGYPDNLHSFWDGIPGTDYAGPDEVMYYVHEKTTASNSAIDNTTTEDWIKESYELAKSEVYTDLIKTGKDKSSLNDAYSNTARRVSRQRIRLAGERLAKLLNENLK